MRLFQKVIIAILGIMAIVVVGVTVYGVQFYNDAQSTFNNISQTVNRQTTKRETQVSIEDREPFSILLLGIDSGGLGRTEQGRSDTMMVVTVNPKEKQSTIVSLDRDIYSQIVGYGTLDKLNHAYAFGGIEMAMDTVESLLDIPIDHYVTINLQGMSDLVEAIGGLDIHNEYHFELDGVELTPGDYHMNGEEVLAYSRFRKYDEVTGMGDPEGDIGRQKRQREVVEKIVNKVLSLDGISNYQNILKAVEQNSKTDLTWNDMLDVATNYVPAFDNIQQEQLDGESQMIDDIYYQILSVQKLLDIQNILKSQLNLPTSETLSVGDAYTNGYSDAQFYDEEFYYDDYSDYGSNSGSQYNSNYDVTGNDQYGSDDYSDVDGY